MFVIAVDCRPKPPQPRQSFQMLQASVRQRGAPEVQALQLAERRKVLQPSVRDLRPLEVEFSKLP